MNAEVNEISTGVSKLQTGPIYNDIRRWLSAPDPSSNYNRALKDRHAATGDWFLKGKAYQDWLSETYSLLWLHGIPGCGKTVLSSAIIQSTFGYCESRTNSVVLYFYFDFNNFQKQQHGHMVRSLVSQLLSYNHTVPSKLSELYSSCMSGERQPSLENLLATLHRMMTAFGQVYVVLDALDECEDISDALTTIEKIRSWKDVRCSILVMSRIEKDIEDSFMSSSGAAETVRLQNALVDADIRRYVGERLRTDRRLKRWHKEQLEIEDALMRKANGMFRWAACQLDALCNCRSVHQLRKALSSLPETLDRTYDQILGKVKAEDHQFAAKLLRWLTYSIRPLRLEEIAEVIAIDTNSSPPFDLGKRFEDPSDILEICSSLVSVEDFRHKTERYRKAKIRLAHFSVKEYLVSDRIQHGPAFVYSLKEEVSNELIAQDCLVYLLHLIKPDIWRSTLTMVEYPLARYAARYWIDHIQSVEGPKNEALTLVQELFSTREEIFVNWTQLWDLDCPSWRTGTILRMSTGSPLYYASLLGFLESVEALVNNGADVNVRGGLYGNALIAAFTSGHTEIVQLLAEKGATINSLGNAYGATALVAASFEGRIEIVQLLLHEGADIDAHNRSNVGIALEAASTAGHTELVRFLLDRTAHDDALWVQGALKQACRNEDEEMVQLLLDRGAVVDPKSLLAALRTGQEHVLRILFEHGCHLKQTDTEGRSLCHYACIIGDMNAVEMLIGRGTDLTVTDKQGRNCLHFAAASSNPGSPDVVSMLLKHGFDPNSLDYDDWTPLHWAAKGGIVENIKILEDAGAKFSIEKIGGWTPGDLAVSYDRKATWNFIVCDGCDQVCKP
ncbi:ankyrin repeat-containing domain protein [Usnea florida]